MYVSTLVQKLVKKHYKIHYNVKNLCWKNNMEIEGSTAYFLFLQRLLFLKKIREYLLQLEPYKMIKYMYDITTSEHKCMNIWKLSKQVTCSNLWFHEISIPHRRLFGLNPYSTPPPWNFHFNLNFGVWDLPPAQNISNDLSWGAYAYFLELHNTW